MTQVNDETVAAALGPTPWRDFTDRLSRTRVTLGALALIALQAGLSRYVLSHGFFREDDFIIAGLAARPFSLHLLFQNYSGNLMPGVFALAWLLDRVNGYDWGLWAGTMAVLQALAGLAMLRALRTLIGNRPLILIPLAVFLFTPLTVPALSWWAAGANAIPMELAIPLAVDQHVRYVRSGRIRNVIFACVWLVLGVVFLEKAIAIALLLFALTSAWLMPGTWVEGMRMALRRYWLAWTLYLSVMIAEIVIFVVSLSGSLIGPKVPPASSVVAFSWNIVWDTFVPGAVGGPWRWARPPGSLSFFLFTSAAPPRPLTFLAGALAAAVVVASLWYRARAWRAWVILLGWLLVVDVGPIALGRLALFGAVVFSQTIYVADAAPVLAICLAVAFLPLRGEEAPYRARPPQGWARSALIGTATAVFIAGSAFSDVAYQSLLHPQASRSYMATLEYALAKAPSGAVIYPEQLPTQMAWTLFGQLSQVQNALAPVVREVSGKNFQWTAWPTGTVNNFLIFDEQGQLEQATVMGISSYPLSRPWDCLLTARGMRLPLPATAYAIPLLIQIPYFASAPVKLAVTFGGHHYTVTLAASKLADGYLPVEGPGNVVLITPLTANPKVCISGVTVGTVQVSDRATPIPLFPLPG